MPHWFFDWLKLYQDFDYELPLIGERACIHIDAATGEQLRLTQPPIKHEGSHSTTITITISSNRLTVTGNPSRINRLDNLFGYTRLTDCVAIYNAILRTYGLPEFTPCTQTYHRQNKAHQRVETYSDGAMITELHITTNQSVGQGNEEDYLRGMASQRYRHSIPRLLTNGKTVDWLPANGNRQRLIYPSMYHKAHELGLHLLPRIKKLYGADSEQYRYVKQVKRYCEQHGVIRAELKLKSQFLREHNYRYYGLFTEGDLTDHIETFINTDNQLKVNAMNLQYIAQTLLTEHIVNTTYAANTTASYALRWMHGEQFDFKHNGSAQKHRTRLRKIGIDIANRCDISTFSPIRVVSTREIVRQPLAVPDWYRRPRQLRLVA